MHYLEIDAATTRPAGGQQTANSGHEPASGGQAAMTLPEAAARFGIPERTLRHRIARGEIAAWKGPRRRWLIDAAALATRHAQRAPGGHEPASSGQLAATGGQAATVAEVEFLRARLVAAEETIRDLRALLLANRLPMGNTAPAVEFRINPKLPATGYPRSGWGLPDVSPPRPAPAPRRRWWPWRRLAWLAEA